MYPPRSQIGDFKHYNLCDSTKGGPTSKTNRIKHKYHAPQHSAMQASTDGVLAFLETSNHINANSQGFKTKLVPSG